MYRWVAVYKDGSVLEQYKKDRTPQEVSSEKIDRANLDGFVLFDDILGRVVIELHLDEGQRLIYRRRTAMNVGGDSRVCHLVGWQMTVNGNHNVPKNIQSIAYCFENEGIVFAGKFREGHPWLYPLVLTEVEKQNGLTED